METKNGLDWFVFVILLGLLAAVMSGCSFKLEFGYHGQTGRDDTTVTREFIQNAKQRKY